mgnify:CR=1 FL=1
MSHRCSIALIALVLAGCESGTLYIGPADTDTDTDTDTDEPCEEVPWYLDSDGDGWGRDTTSVVSCEPPEAGWVQQPGDCDDRLASIHPNAPEQCNSADDDCNGVIDDGVEYRTWYRDADHDGHAGTTESFEDCQAPEGWFAEADDCNDSDASMHPGAFEHACDGIDSNCDGAADGPAGLNDESYPSIQEAIRNVSNGDTITVCPGEHQVNLNFERNRQVTIAGYNADPTTTVLTGGGTGRILYLEYGNLTITNLTFKDGNGQSASGGAISAYQPRGLHLDNVIFEGNQATNGGAISFKTGNPSYTPQMTVLNSTFSDNGSTDVGGAIYLDIDKYKASAAIAGSSFSSNETLNYGGAVGLVGDTETTLVISGTTFSAWR